MAPQNPDDWTPMLGIRVRMLTSFRNGWDAGDIGTIRNTSRSTGQVFVEFSDTAGVMSGQWVALEDFDVLSANDDPSKAFYRDDSVVFTGAQTLLRPQFRVENLTLSASKILGPDGVTSVAIIGLTGHLEDGEHQPLHVIVPAEMAIALAGMIEAARNAGMLV